MGLSRNFGLLVAGRPFRILPDERLRGAFSVQLAVARVGHKHSAGARRTGSAYARAHDDMFYSFLFF